MPAWAHLKPSAIADHLAGVWTFDYERGSGEFTGRMAGSNIMVGFGKSFMGTRLRDLHSPHVFEIAQAFFTRVVCEPACVRFSGKLFKLGETIVEGERIILPIGASDGANGVLGATFYDHPIWRTPDRLELIHDLRSGGGCDVTPLGAASKNASWCYLRQARQKSMPRGPTQAE